MESPTFTLLGGQLTLANTPPRPTEDALWLAAALPVCKEEYLEFGLGNGAAAMALLRRAPNAVVHGIEIEKELATLATHNALLNNLAQRLHVHVADAQTFQSPQKFQHSFSNPPFHNVTTGFYSTSKQVAHGTSPQALATWVQNMHDHTQKGGTCTVIIHADMRTSLPPAGLCVYLKSHPQHPAKRVILQWHVGSPPPFTKEVTLETFNQTLRKEVLEHGAPLPNL